MAIQLWKFCWKRWISQNETVQKPNVPCLFSGRQCRLSLWLTAINQAIMMNAGMETQSHTFLSPMVIDVSFRLQIPLLYSRIDMLLYPVDDRLGETATWPQAAGKATYMKWSHQRQKRQRIRYSILNISHCLLTFLWTFLLPLYFYVNWPKRKRVKGWVYKHWFWMTIE